MGATERPGTVLELKQVSKSFPGVKALDKVDFSMGRGEIHALMGENGAGKSTLIKLITGLHRRDSGSILLESEPLELTNPAQAPEHGISTVYQEINLVPTLSVAENIFLGRQPMRRGSIDWPTLHARAQEALKRLDIEIDVTQTLAALSVAAQQMVAIARGLDISARVLILDEPTSALDTSETEQLFSIMRRLREEGVSIIFITHFIDQVYRVSDRITVLRNGRLVGSYDTAALPKVDLIASMLGRELKEFELEDRVHGEYADSSDTAPVMEARGVERKKYMHAFDLSIRAGEVTGLAGLLGSGRTETAKLLFGAVRRHGGTTYVNGTQVDVRSPRTAIDHSLGFCPEDRKAEGFISSLTVRENIILATQARMGIFKVLTRKRQQALVDKYVEALSIATPSGEQVIDNLSGGNQQKVIVARWLAADPSLLILDEPTRGIDVGAKAEIQRLVIELSRGGMAVLFISSLLEEVVRCCDRVAVLRDRAKVGELHGTEISDQAIMNTIAKGETR